MWVRASEREGQDGGSRMDALLFVLSITVAAARWTTLCTIDRCDRCFTKTSSWPPIRRMVRQVLRSSRDLVPPLLTLFQDNNQLTINLSRGRALFIFPELAESASKSVFKSRRGKRQLRGSVARFVLE